MTRKLSPLHRMSREEYLRTYSKGDTFDHGLSAEELENFRIQLHELCLETLGCDFEGALLFNLMLVTRNTHDGLHWSTVPSTTPVSTREELLDILHCTQYNLTIAHSEQRRAWESYQRYMRKHSE